MIHELKTLPPHFENALSGDKPFEIRNNEDRGFQKGDTVILREYDPFSFFCCEQGYTPRSITGQITYVTNFNQRKGLVVFAYKTSKIQLKASPEAVTDVD